MVRFLAAALLLPSLWRCVVVVEAQSADGEVKRSVIRKHLDHPAEQSALQLGATGEIVHVKKSGDASSQAPGGDNSCIMEAFPKFGDSTCGEAYIQGTDGTNDCADAVKHSIILQQSECDAARKQAGVLTVTALVPYNETKLCPIGCSNRAGEFFYNPSGDCPLNPQTLGGIPICRRYRYQNSTTHDANDDCPTSYERIMTAQECKAAVACQGFCESDEWPIIGQRDLPVPDDDRPAWADNYNIHVKGCFIRPQDGCAYFNDPMTGTEHARAADPTDPKGLGLCKVSGTAAFPGWKPVGADAVSTLCRSASAPPSPPGDGWAQDGGGCGDSEWYKSNVATLDDCKDICESLTTWACKYISYDHVDHYCYALKDCTFPEAHAAAPHQDQACTPYFSYEKAY